MKNDLLTEIMKSIKTDKESKETETHSLVTPDINTNMANMNIKMSSDEQCGGRDAHITYMKVFCYCGTEILPQDKYEREQGLCEQCLVKVYSRPKQHKANNQFKSDHTSHLSKTINNSNTNTSSDNLNKLFTNLELNSSTKQSKHEIIDIPAFLMNDNASKPLNNLNNNPVQNNPN